MTTIYDQSEWIEETAEQAVRDAATLDEAIEHARRDWHNHHTEQEFVPCLWRDLVDAVEVHWNDAVADYEARPVFRSLANGLY